MRFFSNYFILFFCPLLFAQNTAQLDSLLRKGIEARIEMQYPLSLEILTNVRTVAEENQWYKQQFLALNNIGTNYYAMLDYGEALDNYLEAYTIALKHLDNNEEMIVLNNIAILYSKEGDLPKAQEYFLKAYVQAKEHNESIKIGIYAINLGIVANQLNRLDEATNYLKEANEMLQHKPSIAIIGDIALAENKYKRGEFLVAQSLAQQILPKLDPIANIEERVLLIILLSNIAKDIDEGENSILYAQQALHAAENYENKIMAYEQLATVYEKSKLYSKALRAKDSLISLSASVNNMKNGKLFETNRVKFEIADYQRELKLNKELNQRETTTLYGLLGAAILVIFLIAWALRNMYLKNKQRKILNKRSKEIINLELQKKESDNLLLEKQLVAKETMALLEQERLRNEIENRNRKLATKALQISSRNELLKEVINSLSGQTEVTKNALLSKKVKELKMLLKGDAEWESFLTHFEEVNHGFLSTLKKNHPELTVNDIRYLSNLYMDLSSKEIASLFNITVEASRKRKERISSKIGLKDSQQLYSYISSI
ncbi:tetratricopeptide repeat protein [Winogradskyella pacifica]|uniref:tetratricopeptide repeat protein n=1 Tax=Winogradskyella pacifica TaxID=664642 RepID=UPI0015C7F2CB|nr:tetratricopeptide repeat protein [Winogradskyella pacifica]